MFLTYNSLEHKGNLPSLTFFQIPRSFHTPVNDYAMPLHSLLVQRALCIWSFTQIEIHVLIQCQQILTGHFCYHMLSLRIIFFFTGATTHCGFCILRPSSGAIASSLMRFLGHTQRRATVGRAPLDE